MNKGEAHKRGILSLEEMLQLRDQLGIPLKKSRFWWGYKDREGILFVEPEGLLWNTCFPQVPAYDVNNLIELLPKTIDHNGDDYSLIIDLSCNEVKYEYNDLLCASTDVLESFDFFDNYLVDALFNMIWWCVRNGYIKVKDKEDDEIRVVEDMGHCDCSILDSLKGHD